MATEKHGGLWFDATSEDGWTLVVERYEPAVDLLGAVFRKASLFRAVVYAKENDPQWRLPWWSERHPDALFASQEEAVSYLRALLSLNDPASRSGEEVEP